MKYAGIKRFLILIVFLFLYFAVLCSGIWLIKPDPALTVSIPLRLLASIGAGIIFFKWRDWRILLVGAMFFLTTIRLFLTLFLGGEILDRTIVIEQIKEFPSLLASILACLSIIYLWRVFEKSRRVRVAEFERDQSYSALKEQLRTFDCLYNLSLLLRSNFITSVSILEQAVKIIPRAFQEPSAIGISIAGAGHNVVSSTFVRSSNNILHRFFINENLEEGLLEISLLQNDKMESPLSFSEHERNSIPTIASLLGSSIERLYSINELNRSKQLLEEQNIELEQKNSALKEILEHIESERTKVQDEVALNIENFIMPLIEKLSLNSSSAQQAQLDILKTNLNNILSTFGRKISGIETQLSPREIEISNLIKNGLSSKEIADLLRISIRTVERYRYNIRVKLDIVNQKINLITYLQSI